jgi:photosystem II stability/assembly factor-like uncharacterized protein
MVKIKMSMLSIVCFLLINFQSFADNYLGKWVQVNPSLTSQLLGCSFFVNPAFGWAGGRNGAIVHTEDSGATWVLQQTPRNCSIYSIYFFDESIGWAVGKYGVLYTTNGGKNWIERDPGAFSSSPCNKIYFQNRKIGWLLLDVYTHNLAYTQDSGNTWIDKSDLINSPNLWDICFANDSVGVICGGDSIIRTNNGGKTWIKADSIPAGFGSFYKLQMINAATGYCLGWFGIAKTIDSGKTWQAQVNTVEGGPRFETINFISADTGFALYGFKPMTLFKTINGGAIWTHAPAPNLMETVISISMLNNQKGIGVSNDGAILKIQGYGNSFTEITKGTGDELNCIDFCDSKHGLAGTGEYYDKDSALLYTSDGGTTWAKKITPLKTIRNVLYFDTNNILIYTQDSMFHCYRSTNGGSTWTHESSIETGEPQKISALKNAAYIFEVDKDDIIMTTDAGKTWLPTSIPTQTFLYFYNKDTIYSAKYVTDHCELQQTINGGSTWKTIANPTPFIGFSDMFLCTPLIGWVVGNDVFHKNPFIYRTDDGGKTWRQQNNINYFPDFYMGPENLQNFELVKVIALNDGKQAWVLDNWNGILHTVDGGATWNQDTIPASPGMGFTDLYFNNNNNSLWLTDSYFGIWKYEIQNSEIVKKPISQNNKTKLGNIFCRNNNIECQPFFSDKINLQVFNVSGRMVFERLLNLNDRSTSVSISLKSLPAGHYLGNVRFLNDGKLTLQSFINFNICK